MTEQFVNLVNMTLVNGVNASATTVAVVPSATLPGTGTFRLLIEQEILSVTANLGNGMLTVVRGTEGTLAAVHSANVAVVPILTAGAIAQLKTDLAGSIPRIVHALTDANLTIVETAQDVYVTEQGMTANRTITLPNTLTSGQRIDIADADGSLAQYTLTVAGNGKTINGLASLLLNAARASLSIQYNGSVWNIL